MMRLIDADALLSDLGIGDAESRAENVGEIVTAEYIDGLPTITPERLVRYRRWLWADDGYLRCSNCHQKAPQFEHEAALESYATKYCPHCGARMDREEHQ